MVEKLFKVMMEEKHDFYHYIDMMEDCSDPSARTIFYSIAEQEASHYKKIYDMIFKDDAIKVWTPMEKAVHSHFKKVYDEMVEILHSSK